MKLLLQLINGLHVGSIFALIALGYNMVYGIVKLINFAHGEVIMVGAYVALLMLTALTGVPLWVAAVTAIAACALLGMTVERLAYKPLRSSPRISLLITAIGVSLLLQNLAMLVFRPDPRPFPRVLNLPPIELGSVQISMATVLTVVVSLALMLLLNVFIHKSRLGKAIRAVSEDAGAASLMGINVNSTISLTFAIGSALAAVGAIFYCMAYPQVKPEMGALLGLKAFVAAVLGGIGSIPGAVVGGLLIGLAESLTKGYISSQLSDAVVFGILIIVLLIKPSGLFGKNEREKV